MAQTGRAGEGPPHSRSEPRGRGEKRNREGRKEVNNSGGPGRAGCDAAALYDEWCFRP